MIQSNQKSHQVVYFEVQKGMYGLPQAGKIAHDQLEIIWKIEGIKRQRTHLDFGSITNDQYHFPCGWKTS